MKQRIIDFCRNVPTFLQNKESKEVFTFLAFLLLATIFWFITSLNDSTTSTYKIVLEYTNIPSDAVVLKELPTTVAVELKSKGSELLNYHFKGFKPIEIDFSLYSQMGGVFTIPASQIATSLRTQLSNNATILSQQPDTIGVFYTQQPGKRLPILYNNSVTTTPHYVIEGELHYSTDSVTLYAPKQLLEETTAVYAEAATLHNLTDSATVEIAITPIYGAKIEPSSITLTVPVEELTLKTLELPIRVYNLPEEYSIITFPPSVSVRCMVPISKFTSLTNEAITVGVDGGKLLATASKTAPLEITKAPSYLAHIELSSQEIEYIIEELTTQSAL